MDGRAIVRGGLSCVYLVATEPADPGLLDPIAQAHVNKVPDLPCGSFLRVALLAFLLCTPILRGGAAPGPLRTAPNFQILWSIVVGGGESHMMVIHDGTVYAQITDGSLLAVELKTGRVRARATNVALATGPFVVGDWVYSWRPGLLTELDRFTLQPRKAFPVYYGSYFENVPFDRESDTFFVRKFQPGTEFTNNQITDDLGAFSRKDGRELWGFRFPGVGWDNNNSSPLLPGDDSVYVQCASLTNWMYRLDKRTGAVRWVTDLGVSRVNQFNNPIYDRKHDQIYGSLLNGSVFALRRTDGAMQWSRTIGPYLICSSLTYHGGIVYVPLWNPNGTGAVVALDALNGNILWFKEGFYGEDGWSATAVCDRYLYRSTHGTTPSKIIVQDRFTGEEVWSADGDGIGYCTNPILSDGIAVFGTSKRMIALKVGEGLPVNCVWHGVNATGANPGAILWEESDRDPDVDGDGLSDMWEADIFGHLFQQGTDDYDGDGLNNGVEQQLGLDALAPEPRDVRAFVGEKARFAVTVRRPMPVRFQWLREGVAIPGATNSFVEVGPLNLQHEGSRWSVRLIGGQGVFESRTAVLQVTSAPEWSGGIRSMELSNGRVNGTVDSAGSVTSLDLLFSSDLKDWRVVTRFPNPGPSLQFSEWADTVAGGFYRVYPTPPSP